MCIKYKINYKNRWQNIKNSVLHNCKEETTYNHLKGRKEKHGGKDDRQTVRKNLENGSHDIRWLQGPGRS